MLKIEKNVPIPDAMRFGKPRKYPFAEMDVGDSFFAPNVGISAMAGSITYASKRHGKKFATRFLTENGVKGVRVWRVA